MKEKENKNQITVCDRGGKMRKSDRWEEGTDFSNDAWIFETTGAKFTRLVILFRHDDDGNWLAELYDDVTGDGNVRHKIEYVKTSVK